MEDPLTGDFPSRVATEDEERDAQGQPSYRSVPPIVTWSADMERQLQIAGRQVALLVMATSLEACALLGHLLPLQQAIGSILLPEVSLANSSVRDGCCGNACTLFALQLTSSTQKGAEADGKMANGSMENNRMQHPSDTGEADGEPLALIGLARQDVPPERAVAWATGLAEHVTGAHMIVVASMPVREYVGPRNPHEEDPVFSLRTSSAQEMKVARSCDITALSTGNLVQGLPAALLSRCEVSGASAELIVSIQAARHPESQTLKALAKVLGPLLADQGLAVPRLTDAVLRAAGNDLQQWISIKKRSSASVYV